MSHEEYPFKARNIGSYKPKPSYKSCAEIADDARRNRLWVYNKDSRKWYTPDEFLELFEKTSFVITQKLLDNYIISNPIEGLKVRTEFAIKISREVCDFAVRVTKYYQDLEQG